MFTAEQLKEIKFGFNGLLDLNKGTAEERIIYAKAIGDAMGLILKIHLTSKKSDSWQAIVEAAEAMEPTKARVI